VGRETVLQFRGRFGGLISCGRQIFWSAGGLIATGDEAFLVSDGRKFTMEKRLAPFKWIGAVKDFFL